VPRARIAPRGVDPRGKRVVVLGAGGAARAIATEIDLAEAAEISVVNRSTVRVRQMTDDLRRNLACPIHLLPWNGTYGVREGIDILVNATSIGLFPDIHAMPPVDLSQASAGMLVCDVVFNPSETRLLAAARERGLPALDRLSMLVHQGVIGFEDLDRAYRAGTGDEGRLARRALRRIGRSFDGPFFNTGITRNKCSSRHTTRRCNPQSCGDFFLIVLLATESFG